MSMAREAYNRAFHCGVGGHDGHLCDENDKLIDPKDQIYEDRCALAVEWNALRTYAIDLRVAAIEAMDRCPCVPDEHGIPCLSCQSLDDRANEHTTWMLSLVGGRTSELVPPK